MSELRRVVESPWPYAAWALVVLATLAAAYAADPYLFGLAVFVLGGLSTAIGIIGGSVALLARTTDRRARALIGASLAVTAVALLAALRVLGTFKWA
jgi:hypothetical protein